MGKVSEEKKVADKVKARLYEKGFKVYYQFSKNTKSIYLKVDNGACCSIRISDHKNYKTRSKFNMIKNYKVKRTNYKNGIQKRFYNFNMLDSLISDVEAERANKIFSYGYIKYKSIRDKNTFYNDNQKVA